MANASSCEPGSVTNTNRPAKSSTPTPLNAASKARRWESVSTVEPDLEETTTAVRRSDSSPISARTWPGSVVSRTLSPRSRVREMTSGARDEPPMPHSAMWSMPCSANSARSFASGSMSSLDFTKVSTQPSRIAASASASGPHRAASFAASLAGTPSLLSRSTTALTSTPVVTARPPAASIFPIIAYPRFSSFAWAASLDSTSASSSFQLAANLSTPSSSRTLTTSS